jgi:CelD/BcsL family acetyltransferase involved in cellulose biosynthesis
MFILDTKSSANRPREEAKPMPRFRETGAETHEGLRARYDARRLEEGQRYSDPGQSLSLTVTPALDVVEADWKDLQERAAVSPYQRFDLADAWARHAAAGAGLEARIGVARDVTGRVVMILPFGLIRRLGTTVGVYLGGSHFNLNMPLVDPELRIGPSLAANILDQYCDATGADLLLLYNQPKSWKQTSHPFLCLPHYDAADDVRLITIADGDYEGFLANQLTRKMRSELRRKTLKFEEAGVCGAVRASTAEEVDRFLAAFIGQKSKRLASQGVDDPFAVPGVKDFLRDAALSGLAGTGGMEMHAVRANGHLASVRAGMRHRDHYAFMVQSFDTEDPLAKYSPSEYLMAEVLADSCKQRVTSFDFGVGDGRFKKVWSNDVVDLFNVTYAVTKKGQLYASVMQLSGAAMRYIKRNRRLFSAMQEARALSARLRGQTES